MSKKLVKLVKDYREHLNPPYSRRDLPALLVTLVLVLSLPLLVLFALKVQSDRTNAAVGNRVLFVNPQTLQPVQSITSPTVGVLLTPPWPIAFTGEGLVAGDSTQENDMSGYLAKETGGSDSSKDHPGTTATVGVGNPKSTSTVNPIAPSTTTTPVATITSSILLAQDAAFSQNVMTISPVTSNPTLATYTFSNANLGTKTLYAKFVSSRGDNLTYSNSIQLVAIGSATPTPIATNATPPPPPPIGGGIQPYPGAPLCPDSGTAHNNSLFHTLWDSARGCHYDHEHGTNPFTPAVAAEFPGFNLYSLLGNVGIGHTNPSGAMENTMKHGGFKWNVQLTHPEGCTGFESARNGVNGSVIQYHAFGDYRMELEAGFHSAAALLRQCNVANPNDFGYIYTVQFINYGQIVSPYQGDLLTYPYYSVPAYDPSSGPYLNVNCIGQKLPGQRGACRSTLSQAQNNVAASNWTAKNTGFGARPENSITFRPFFRLNDTYQMLDWDDQTYPYTFLYLCTSDNGATYNPSRCRYNNSTTQMHEIAGTIPAAWDNLSGFDTDPRVGRITAQGYTTHYGTLNQNCSGIGPGPDCHPIKLVNAFVGTYGSVLVFTTGKGTNIVPDNPSRNIYFCGSRVCSENEAGAVPSGWIGQNN